MFDKDIELAKVNVASQSQISRQQTMIAAYLLAGFLVMLGVLYQAGVRGGGHWLCWAFLPRRFSVFDLTYRNNQDDFDYSELDGSDGSLCLVGG